jgi:hypothetical protein
MSNTAVSRRAGRKRADGLRTLSGQLSRRVDEEIDARHPAAVMRLVRDSLRGYADPAYGSPLGRLFLDGKLSPAEFEAGKRWDRLMRRYHIAIGAPPPDTRSRPLTLHEAIGASPPPDPASPAGREQAERDREIVEACRAAHAIIVSHGLRAERDMRRLCEGLGEYPPGAEALARAKAALGSLAKFWRLSRTR